jgi:hypothetical protein
LRYLAACQRDLRVGFDKSRATKAAEYASGGYVNPGRLATIYCLLRGVWSLMAEGPFSDVVQELNETFLEVLDEAIKIQGEEVNSETEISRFLQAIKTLRVSRPDLFMIGEVKGRTDRILGRENANGLFLFPEETLSLLKQLGVFTQIPSIESITKALKEENLLRPPSKKQVLNVTKIDNKKVRGWWLVPSWNESIECDDDDPRESDEDSRGTEKSDSRGLKSRRPAVPQRNELYGEKISGEKKEEIRNESNGIVRDCGTESNKIVYTNSIDSVLVSPANSPALVPQVPPDIDLFSALDSEAKQRLWIAIGNLLRHPLRQDAGRIGLMLSDLASTTKLPETQLKTILEASGWTSSPIEASGLIVWWAPEKVLKAYGLEAGP